MSGRAYTMKEMKVIVEYLVGTKAYGEVKGRKMWMDFANTQLTIRTWQSLKETFLKRILPDIHNPYYRLTVDQIQSFRAGYDVAEKDKNKEINKLEIVDLDDDHNSNAENQEESEQPSTSRVNNEEATSGEDVTSCTKVPTHGRESVDTVIIPTCYETAEDIQRELESPKSVQNDNVTETNNKTPPTKLRDLITYSEPLTPMLQEVLHDFASDGDSDSGEIRMQIVEEPIPDPEPQVVSEESPIEVADSESQNVAENSPIEILDSEDVVTENNAAKQNDNAASDPPEESEPPDFVPPKILSLKLKKRKGGYIIDKKKNGEKSIKHKSNENTSTEVEQNESISEICNTIENPIVEKEVAHLEQIPEKSPPNISTSADTILPNNQEALEKSGNSISTNEERNRNDTSKSKKKAINFDKNKSKTRKRAISQEVSSSKMKKNLLAIDKKIKERAVSDTDTTKKKFNVSRSENLKLNLIKQSNLVKLPSSEDNNKEDVRAEPKIDSEIEPHSNEVERNKSTDLSQLNPCLKSVSLFAEQFNQVSYIDSESEHEAETSGKKIDIKKKTDEANPKTDRNKNYIDEVGKRADERKKKLHGDKKKKESKTVNIANDVVMLKSHSDSESDVEFSPKASNMPDSRLTKSQRDKVFANIFGFSSGAVGTKRKRHMSHRKNSTHRYPRHDSSENSSEWTSESDSEVYVSPPRGRRNRQSRKYLKPKSARILSLEEEGGLFVMYGKKIYPVVKDGKIIKNYLTYFSESDPEEEESYWKSKYVEERMRVDELKKIVNQNNQMNPVREKSPILPAKSLRNIPEHRSPAKSLKKNIHDQQPIPPLPKQNNEEVNDKGKTLKITFAKNNQEVHVEGHWSNIHPVLAEVVQIFNKDSDSAKQYQPNGHVDSSKQLSDASSEKSVAIVVDKEVHEKVNKLETEIFKEIEQRDQEEQVEMKVPSETNVTKRKRALSNKSTSSNQSSVARKSSTSSPQSPKRQKTSEANKEKTIQQESEPDQKPIDENNLKAKIKMKPAEKKVSKSESKSTGKKVQKKIENKALGPIEPKVEDTEENVEDTNSKTNVRTRRQTKTPKKDEKEAVTPNTNTTRSTRNSKTAVQSPIEADDEVRYMFPPAKKSAKTPKTALSLTKTRENKRYMAAAPEKYSSQNLSIHSESTQGYQDSDNSPPKAKLRRKRKLSLNAALSKIRQRSHRSLRKSFPIIDDRSSDSNSSFHIIVRPTGKNSTLKSEAYKSDSYQFLFPNSQKMFRPLEKIEEDQSTLNDMQVEKNLKSTIIMNNDYVSCSNGATDGGNSSNVSLPLSPELSIVENLSISKEMLNSAPGNPSLNEIQANHEMSEIHDKYVITHIDVSMPLMEQECSFQPSLDIIKTEHSFDAAKPSVMPDSLVNKINVVNIEEAPSLSESLDTRLRNLLLESAKKMSIVEDNNKNDKVEVQKKAKSGKRCSTPRKKTNIQKRKRKITEPVVEEECTESCSYGGRKSCPPAIQLMAAENVCKENIDTNIEKEIVANEKNKGRRKKDVIKVKILRPKSKTRKEVPSPNDKIDTTKNNDSGINETESVISNQGFSDSIDLIHNHSETCLHANECLADSVEFLETTASIISLNTDSASTSSRRSFRDQIVFKDCEALMPGSFCQNAQQDWTNVDHAQQPFKINTDHNSETVYHSPILSDTSLITDDLSDETPLSQENKWYLLSEDDTRTANANIGATNTTSSFGANLKQIFPITCAVPDLSTITEMSNENSRKPTLESDASTRFDLDSQSNEF